MVQLVNKPNSPLKGGKALKIIPLPIQTFIIHIPMTTNVNQSVEGCGRSDKKHVEHVNISFTILDNRLESSKFLSTKVLMSPHQIGIGQEVILISNTSHALKIFTTPIVDL
jgi:hypothetical protein